MKHFALLLAGLLLWPGPSQAAVELAKPPPANHIVVSTLDGLELFDPGLGHLGELFELAASGDEPDFLPLPDGRFVVAQNTLLRVLDAGGTELGSVDFFETITGLELGPGGDIVVATENQIILWDLGADAKTGIFDIAGATSPSFTPRGFLAFDQGPTIKVLDLRTGVIVQEITPSGEPVHGIARRADGAHAVVAGDQIFLFDSEFKPIADLNNVAGSGSDPDFLPSGDVLVTSDTALAEFDGQTLDFIRQVPVPEGDGGEAHVIPHVFEADLDGDLVMADGTFLKVKTTGLVGWTPGKGRAVLLVADPEATTALGDDTFVFQGFEADAGGTGQRLVNGTASLGVAGALGADAFGFIGTSGFYFADGFDGQIHLGRGANVLLIRVKSKTLLNP